MPNKMLHPAEVPKAEDNGVLTQKERRTAESIRRYRMPVLVIVSAIFSAWSASFLVIFFVGRVASLHVAVAPLAADAQQWADAAVQVSAHAAAMTGQVQHLWSIAQEQRRTMMEVQGKTSAMISMLEPLPEQLRPDRPSDSDTIEMALEYSKGIQELFDKLFALQYLKFKSGFNEMTDATSDSNSTEHERSVREELERMSAAVSQHKASAKLLREMVIASINTLEDFVSSLAKCAVSAGIISLLVVLPVLARMLKSWPGVRQAVATGEAKKSATWQPVMFHPVKAPGLPGMMASSIVFATVLLFVCICVFLVAVRWLPELLGMKPDVLKAKVSTFMWTAGPAAVVKTFILDQVIGRRLITERGFVTHWVAFAWYIIIVIPLTVCSGIALAATRFAMLLVIAAAYVVRLDITIFPPYLQRLDSGYATYMASILLDHRHRGPIWSSFVDDFLVERIAQRQGMQETPMEDCRAGKPEKASAVSRRWQLAVTLANNPQLAKERRHVRERDDHEDHEVESETTSASEPVAREFQAVTLLQNWVKGREASARPASVRLS